MPRKYSRRRRSSKKAKKSTKRRYQGAWSGWLKELALESDKKELEKMVQEEEQRLEEFMSKEMKNSESEKRLLRRILYPHIAVSVWLLYMELKKQRRSPNRRLGGALENFYSIGRRGARGVLPVIGGATRYGAQRSDERRKTA